MKLKENKSLNLIRIIWNLSPKIDIPTFAVHRRPFVQSLVCTVGYDESLPSVIRRTAHRNMKKIPKTTESFDGGTQQCARNQNRIGFNYEEEKKSFANSTRAHVAKNEKNSNENGSTASSNSSSIPESYAKRRVRARGVILFLDSSVPYLWLNTIYSYCRQRQPNQNLVRMALF